MGRKCTSNGVGIVVPSHPGHVLQRKCLSFAKPQRNQSFVETGKPNFNSEAVHPFWEYEFVGACRIRSGPLECIQDMSQVSSGVTVAYVSSIALLVLAALQPPSHHPQMEENPSYLDAVIFLTMFLLAGQYSITPSVLRSSLTDY